MMALQIGDTAPDFEAETTEGKIRFHDCVARSGENPERWRRSHCEGEQGRYRFA